MADIAEQYELVERIAVGGMAEVFRANRLQSGGASSIVAVKRILPELASNEEFVRRFCAEAVLALGLEHRNIVQAFDFGRFGDSLFIAMEYLDGGDLEAVFSSARTRGHPLALGAALHAGAGLLDGLRFAHDRGVIHRDISPSNILVSREGTVKITDFGIAKAAGVELTNQHRVMGKWPYMSPEQVDGADLDARTDLFSAGVVIYEMVTGARLFRGKNIDEIRKAILGAPIEPPRSARPELSPAQSDAIMSLLERDPDRRADAISVAAALGGGSAADLAAEIESLNPAVPTDTDPSLLLLDDIINSELAHARERAPGKRVTLAATASSPRHTEQNPVRRGRTLVKTAVLENGLSQWLVGDESGTYAIEKTALLYAVDGEREPREDDDEPPARPAIEPPSSSPRHTILDATGGPADARSNPPMVKPAEQRRGSITPWLIGAAVIAAVTAAVLLWPRGGAQDSTISLTSRPSGAEVWLGERKLGITPLRVAHPGVGETLEFRLPDHATCLAVLEVGAKPVSCTLVSAPATLTVSSTPAGATVLVEGEPIGETPIAARELEPRSEPVEIVLELSGYRRETARVLLAAGSAARVSKQLEAEVAEAGVDIESEPWANIYFRGKKIGVTPVKGLLLPEGQHELTLVNPEESRRTTLTVTVPGQKTYAVTLPAAQ